MKQGTENRLWYSFATIFRSASEGLHDFLQDNNLKHEISMAGEYYYFEINLSEIEKDMVNNYLNA